MRSKRSSAGRSTDRRALVGAFLTAAMLVVSGCAGIGGSDVSPTPETTETATITTAPSDTPTEQTATASSTERSSDDGSDHEDDEHDHDDHYHGTEEDTAAEEGAATESGAATAEPSPDAAATGRMTVVVAGTELDPAADASGRFWFDEDVPHTWHGSGDVTVAGALEVFDATATQESLTYDGTTYRDGEDGVSVNVRVNGDEVDPTARALEDGDEAWVTVETPDMNVSTPGEYIRADDQHIHGPISFVVNGTEVDFSEDRYQSTHRHFHFEGGHAEPWHAHSYSVTLGYALSTLPGIDVTADTVTYNGTTYRDDGDAEVTVEVNGEPVDPTEYYLKDGDSVRVEISNGS